MKKTILSFLLLGSACAVMAQQQPTSGNPNANKNNTQNTVSSPATNSPVNSNPSNVNNNNTLNGNNNPVNTNATQNNNQNNTANPNNTINNENTSVNGSMNTNTTYDNNMNSNKMPGSAATGTYTVTVPASVQGSFLKDYPTAANVSWQQSGDWYRARYREDGKIMQVSYREDGKSMTITSAPVMRTYVPEEIVNKAIDMYGVNVYAIAKAKGTNGQDIYNVTVIENGQSKTEWMNEDGTAAGTPYRTETDESMTNKSNINKDMDDESVNTSNTVEETTSGSINTSTENRETATPDNSGLTPDDTIIENTDSNPEDANVNNNMNTDALNNGSTDNRVRKDDDAQTSDSDATTEPQHEYEY